jgi:hypothetical protein
MYPDMRWFIWDMSLRFATCNKNCFNCSRSVHPSACHFDSSSSCNVAKRKDIGEGTRIWSHQEAGVWAWQEFLLWLRRCIEVRSVRGSKSLVVGLCMYSGYLRALIPQLYYWRIYNQIKSLTFRVREFSPFLDSGILGRSPRTTLIPKFFIASITWTCKISPKWLNSRPR